MLKALTNSCVHQSIFLAGIVYYVFFYITCGNNVARDFQPKLSLLGMAPTQENSVQDIVQILDDAEGECQWGEGDWVWDESYPMYESRNCEFLDQAFRCSENGRPNNSYLKWRSQPKNCNIPRFFSS
ncbi:protein trichome birefringence-like protein 11 [Cinnamomum micranthum f. kanehirae]|uniref:Protein trichome birefringence-like protein 11 n=1 Tax=Cinnamomum micranthum f. kanehirae TaxID=337451 RepID=A0A443NDV4_9MAGN|nr:protein trichome birefringence-like protein 11 [Cinnamomum micranthum f. kanehirae]